MPLYEYACHRCGKTIEKLQRFSDPPLTVHEDCGGELEKLISRSAFQLKGSGWYATDYPHRSKPATDSASHESPESKSENKAEAKSESKPESKSETKSESKSETKSESKSESKTESKPAPAGADKSS
jgi:putative FmdB family regulatory protein